MIRGISNNYDINFMFASQPAGQKNTIKAQNTADTDKGAEVKQSGKMARNVSIGAAAAAILGGAAYYFKTGRKPDDNLMDIAKPVVSEVENSAGNVAEQVVKKVKAAGNKIVEYIVPRNKENGAFSFKVYDGDTFIKKVECDGFTDSDAFMKGGKNRQIYAEWADGKYATTSDEYTPGGQLHERTMVRYNDIYRYNFARKDGKVIGYAKEHTHQGFKRDIEPLTVKMFDGKEVKAANILELYETEPSFNPKLMD